MSINKRYLRIVKFFAGLAIHVIFWEIVLRTMFLGKQANRTAQKRYTRAAKRFHALAISMGGVLIKVGQFLSARVDVLPEYITDELSQLQDEAAPESFQWIKITVEREMGRPIEEIFHSFIEQPLASASLGQVHLAELFSGDSVVVKVQRQDIERIVEVDLAAFGTVVNWLKHWRVVSEHADVLSLLDEFSVTLREELDYIAEASNARRFAEIYMDDPLIRIPVVYDDYSTKRMLTLENVGFIKITDYENITSAGIDRGAVAERLLNTYLNQIFVDSFFHADPHPGNLFVEPPGEDHDWRLVFVDFGMVGQVTPAVKEAGREAVMAVITRDPTKLVHSFRDIGALLPDADIDRIITAYTVLFDNYWGKTMDELRHVEMKEIIQFKKQFRDLLFDNPFQIPHNMIYLGRCIAILSGMCTGLNPDFNLFASLVPFGEQLITDEGKEDVWDFVVEQLKKQAQALLLLPSRFENLLARLENGEISIVTRSPEMESMVMKSINKSFSRIGGGLFSMSLILGGTVLYINGETELGLSGWVLGLVVYIGGMIRKP